METINAYKSASVGTYNDYKNEIKRDKKISNLMIRTKKLEKRWDFLSVTVLLLLFCIVGSVIYLIERFGA